MDIIEERISKSNDIITSFQYALIALVLAMCEDTLKQKPFLSLFSDIIKKMDKGAIRICKHYNILENITWHNYLTHGTNEYNMVIDILRELRYDFIRALHAQNTGEKEWTDLN